MKQASWFEELPGKGAAGLYLIQSSTKKKLFRFGMASKCLRHRCGKQLRENGHISQQGGALGRFELVGGWLLTDWPPDRVVMAEQCMFAALAAQGAEPHNPNLHPKQTSIYKLTNKFDPQRFRQRVETELNTVLNLGA